MHFTMLLKVTFPLFPLFINDIKIKYLNPSDPRELMPRRNLITSGHLDHLLGTWSSGNVEMRGGGAGSCVTLLS